MVAAGLIATSMLDAGESVKWPKYGDNAAYIELGGEIKANSAFRVQEFELLSEL